MKKIAVRLLIVIVICQILLIKVYREFSISLNIRLEYPLLMYFIYIQDREGRALPFSFNFDSFYAGREHEQDYLDAMALESRTVGFVRDSTAAR